MDLPSLLAAAAVAAAIVTLATAFAMHGLRHGSAFELPRRLDDWGPHAHRGHSDW